MSKNKSNSMWKLDLLEAKFHGTQARFPRTKTLLTARNTSKLWKRLPTSEEEANKEIKALKKEYFDKKYYGSHKKLAREVNKVVKSDKSRLKSDGSKKDIITFITSLEELENLITSKLIKCITSSILVNKELKENIPYYISKDIQTIIKDKTHKSNPSRFFINHCQNNKELNNYISKLWNSKTIKKALEEIDWSFKLVRGNISKQEKDSRKRLSGKDIQDDHSDVDADSDESDDESEEESSLKDLEEDYDKFAVYDNLVGDSDNEEKMDLDPNVNYNEVTDEEASELENDEVEEGNDSDASHDSFFAEEKKPKEKYQLPELATGYFSGGSDDEDDIDNDQVVKAATTQRKNRRGQRARQKIWEKKYGQEAKHVKSEKAKIASEREQRQLEYEERCRKREEKARLAMENAPTGSNTAPLGNRKPRPDVSLPSATAASEPEKMHPSWEAKRLAEEKQKNIKFQGKKITFD